MNKYQEALDYIKHDLEHNDFIRYKNGNHVDKYHREVLLKLVDKETPMKPIEEDGLLLCGICKNHTVAIEGYTGEEWCCYACGQVIDWDIDND